VFHLGMPFRGTHPHPRVLQGTRQRRVRGVAGSAVRGDKRRGRGPGPLPAVDPRRPGPTAWRVRRGLRHPLPGRRWFGGCGTSDRTVR